MCIFNFKFHLFPVQLHNLPITLKMGRDKIKENFMKNKDVTDIRVIDMLVAKVSIH